MSAWDLDGYGEEKASESGDSPRFNAQDAILQVKGYFRARKTGPEDSYQEATAADHAYIEGIFKTMSVDLDDVSFENLHALFSMLVDERMPTYEGLDSKFKDSDKVLFSVLAGHLNALSQRYLAEARMREWHYAAYFDVVSQQFHDYVAEPSKKVDLKQALASMGKLTESEEDLSDKAGRFNSLLQKIQGDFNQFYDFFDATRKLIAARTGSQVATVPAFTQSEVGTLDPLMQGAESYEALRSQIENAFKELAAINAHWVLESESESELDEDEGPKSVLELVRDRLAKREDDLSMIDVDMEHLRAELEKLKSKFLPAMQVVLSKYDDRQRKNTNAQILFQLVAESIPAKTALNFLAWNDSQRAAKVTQYIKPWVRLNQTLAWPGLAPLIGQFNALKQAGWLSHASFEQLWVKSAVVVFKQANLSRKATSQFLFHVFRQVQERTQRLTLLEQAKYWNGMDEILSAALQYAIKVKAIRPLSVKPAVEGSGRPPIPMRGIVFSADDWKLSLSSVFESISSDERESVTIGRIVLGEDPETPPVSPVVATASAVFQGAAGAGAGSAPPSKQPGDEGTSPDVH